MPRTTWSPGPTIITRHSRPGGKLVLTISSKKKKRQSGAPRVLQLCILFFFYYQPSVARKRRWKRDEKIIIHALLSAGILDLSQSAASWICPLPSCRSLIRTSACVYRSNILDERGVPSMVIRQYWWLWRELLPNIPKWHPLPHPGRQQMNQPFSFASKTRTVSFTRKL